MTPSSGRDPVADRTPAARPDTARSTRPDPYLEDADFTLYAGDVLERLREMPDESVHCIITSPPYWALRDYGTGVWQGGDEDCDHVKAEIRTSRGLADWSAEHARGGGHKAGEVDSIQFRDQCEKCGAIRLDQQLGLEETLDEYVEKMVEVFREVKRVLRKDGTCWLNLGDSYNAYNGNRGTSSSYAGDRKAKEPAIPAGHGLAAKDLKQKELVGMPWRVAFALQADGWYLRSDIVWAKPNPMPESVSDRPTKSHEYVFLLSRSRRYFYDQDAIREPAEWARWGDQTNTKYEGTSSGAGWIPSRPKEELAGGRQPGDYADNDFKTTDERNTRYQGPNPGDGQRNKRDVWMIATESYKDAHFATFPQALVEPCIKAGTSEYGVCPECGAPWIRQTEKQLVVDHEVNRQRTATKTADDEGDRGAWGKGESVVGTWDVKTTGWKASCDHAGTTPVPAVVLDPFMGAGTTALVARRLGRHVVGIELNLDYCAKIATRLQQLSLFA